MTKRNARPRPINVTPPVQIDGLFYSGITAWEGGCAHPSCKAAIKQGFTWHVTPPHYLNEGAESHLVMPTYHYESIEAGIAAIEHAQRTALTVESDEEWLALEAAKEVPFRTRPGMNHPTRR